MSNVTIARSNYVTTDDRDLTMTLLDSVALESFKINNLLWGGGFVKPYQLQQGESTHRWTFFGESPEEGAHHVPGQFIDSGTIVNNFADVSVDDPLIKALRLDYADATLSNYEQLGRYMRECTRINAERLDRRMFQILAKAARTAAVTDVHGGGHVTQPGNTSASHAAEFDLTDAGADALAELFSTHAKSYDDANTPEGNRVAFCTTYARQVLTRSDRLMNRDYDGPENARIRDRYIGELEGFKLYWTQHMPSTNVTTDLAKYNGDFSGSSTANGLPIALTMALDDEESAIGLVQAAGMRNSVYWDENRECWLVKNVIFAGADEVAVWKAGEISTYSA